MVSEMTPKDMQWCLWYAKSYEKTLKALMMLDDFAGETQELHIRILPAEAPRNCKVPHAKKHRSK
jgi:hypothetical protein